MSIENKLKDLYELFSIFEDRKDQFIQLMDMAKESESLKEKEKIKKNKIYGCTSQAWIVSKKNLCGSKALGMLMPSSIRFRIMPILSAFADLY